MSHVIIGTAGHVDHGKTTLVKALTGQDTDRLKEEKERGISIELGFASYQMDDGQKIGLVDVPGHEKFIKQMLAGVAGIDLVLLIIAADEGVMPQTKEHLDIISLLNLQRGIVVVTKADLVEEEWLMLVQDEISQALAGTPLANAPITAVSAKTNQGIEELKALISQEIKETTGKNIVGNVRMPIDRVFSVTGFGTVVTGTMWSGRINVGDKLVLYPKGIESKVRNLQVHGAAVDTAFAGQRVAVNMGNISVEDIGRGDVLAAEGTLVPSFRIDVQLKLLESWEKKLVHRQRIRVHIGTAEVLGRVFLLDREEIEPGEVVLAQLILDEEIVALRGDNFVIRSYSPMFTIGGGIVIDGTAKKEKRFKSEVIKRLKVKLEGTPEDQILQFIRENKFIDKIKLSKLTGIDNQLVDKSLEELEQANKVKCISKDVGFLALEILGDYENKAFALLEIYHQQHPLRFGIPKEELRTRLDGTLTQKQYSALLDYWHSLSMLSRNGDRIALCNFAPQPSSNEQETMDRILKGLRSDLFQPPIKKDLLEQLKISEDKLEELLQYLQSQEIIIKVNEELYVSRETIQQLISIITKIYKEKSEITLGEVRDATKSSRKYILPLLEYLDLQKTTKRIGDKRVLYS